MKKEEYICLNKKALSDVVNTILIILVSIVAIGIVWVVVKGVVSKGSDEVGIEKFSLDLSIKSAYKDGSLTKVNVRRSSGVGSLTGVNFVFKNSTESKVVKKEIVLDQLEEKLFSFTSQELGVSNATEVSVAPIYISSGKDSVGEVTDTADIRSSLPSGSGSGNEQGSGAGTGEPGTGVCGDGEIQNPNGNSESEQCDDGNADNGDGCSSTCQTEEIPGSCDGTWNVASEDAGVLCDGTPLPVGCSASCICTTGFTQNQNVAGECSLNPPINSGILFSVWPSGAPKYLDSENLPTSSSITSDYIGKYVNFTSINENGCFQITLAEYVELNGRSYIRTESVVKVLSGEQYYIWDAPNCGQ